MQKERDLRKGTLEKLHLITTIFKNIINYNNAEETRILR